MKERCSYLVMAEKDALKYTVMEMDQLSRTNDGGTTVLCRVHGRQG